MSTELVHNLCGTPDGDILYYMGDLPYDAFLRLPAGAIGWTVSYQSYAVAEAARMVLSLDKPALTGAPSDGDTRKTLARLLAGEALYLESPPMSGGLGISSYQKDMPVRVDRERILYLNSIAIPGNKLISFQSSILLDNSAPAPAPAPSADQVELVEMVNQSGRATTLRALFPGQTDEAIVAQCDAAGYTAALRKFRDLARGSA